MGVFMLHPPTETCLAQTRPEEVSAPQLSRREFSLFQNFIFEQAGITLGESKQALVAGRLAKRLQHHGLNSYGAYFELLQDPAAGVELQMAIDLLTTYETYFFREPKHFEFLAGLADRAAAQGLPLRVWSAASSSGEEVYSSAMVLADHMAGGHWEVLGSDISTRVIERARRAHYPMERASHIPPDYLRRFCLKGRGPEAGTLLVARDLRAKVQFMQLNLNTDLPQLGPFDLVFLRNVMIYFSGDTKRQVVERVLGVLKPGGHLLIGHSESLHGISDGLAVVAPSIFRKLQATTAQQGASS